RDARLAGDAGRPAARRRGAAEGGGGIGEAARGAGGAVRRGAKGDRERAAGGGGEGEGDGRRQAGSRAGGETSPEAAGGVGGATPRIVPSANAKGTGRRSALAAWLTSPENPLVARVWVNRLWQHHFGRGIVATPSDFGRHGQEPTHRELLDFLANRLVAERW